MMGTRVHRWCCLGAVLAALLTGCGSSTSDPLSTGGGSTSGTTTDNAPGTGIFGRLTNSAGQPVAGATCELVGPTGTVLSAAVTTDEDGSFHLEPPSGGVPDGSVVRVTPHGGMPHTAPVGAPGNGPAHLDLQLGDDGSVGVRLALSAPDDAVSVDSPDLGDLALLHLTGGTSSPFTVRARDTFDLSTRDVALVWRQDGGAWHVQPVTTADGTRPSLRLGAAANGLHGKVLDVALLSAGKGKLNGLTTFEDPGQLAFAVRLSAPLQRVMVVATLDQRVDAAGLLANALVLDSNQDGVLTLRAADVTALGLHDGATVRLTCNGRSADATVRQGAGAAFGLLTARLGTDLLDRLGIDLSAGCAGRRIALVAVP